MKKIIYSILISAFIFSCNSETDSAVNQSFEENSKTMQALLTSYANEDV